MFVFCPLSAKLIEMRKRINLEGCPPPIYEPLAGRSRAVLGGRLLLLRRSGALRCYLILCMMYALMMMVESIIWLVRW